MALFMTSAPFGYRDAGTSPQYDVRRRDAPRRRSDDFGRGRAVSTVAKHIPDLRLPIGSAVENERSAWRSWRARDKPDT